MAVFLTILKVIGIALLVLLGVLLTAVLLVLLVPVRYCAQASYQEKPVGDVRVTWLVRLVAVRAAFDEKLSFCVRLAGIQILPKRERKKKPKSRSEKEREAETDQEVFAEQDPVESSMQKAEETAKPGGSDQEQEAAQQSGKDKKQEAAEQGGTGREQETEQTETQEGKSADGVLCFLDGLLEKVYAIFRNCGDKYTAICVKIEQVRKTIARYLAILRRDETKRLAALAFVQLKKMIRHILPGKLQIHMCIGTGDPASTGQILAVQGMLYPLLGQRLNIVPDFDEKHFEGTFYMKGHVTVIVLLLCALRILINRNFRKLIKLIRKKEEV